VVSRACPPTAPLASLTALEVAGAWALGSTHTAADMLPGLAALSIRQAGGAWWVGVGMARGGGQGGSGSDQTVDVAEHTPGGRGMVSRGGKGWWRLGEVCVTGYVHMLCMTASVLCSTTCHVSVCAALPFLIGQVSLNTWPPPRTPGAAPLPPAALTFPLQP
jgi:hypothetical protein